MVGVPTPPIPPIGPQLRHEFDTRFSKHVPPVAEVGQVPSVVEMNSQLLDGVDFDPKCEKSKCWPCLDDEGKTAVTGGLVMSSIAFLGLTFFTGRNARRPGASERQPDA